MSKRGGFSLFNMEIACHLSHHMRFHDASGYIPMACLRCTFSGNPINALLIRRIWQCWRATRASYEVCGKGDVRGKHRLFYWI